MPHISRIFRYFLVAVIATLLFLPAALCFLLLAYDPNADWRDSDFPNHFATLGIPWGAPTEQVNQAMRRAALLCHPDKLPQDFVSEHRDRALERLRNISDAATLLRDESFRETYLPMYRMQGMAWNDTFRPQHAFRELEKTCRPAHRWHDRLLLVDANPLKAIGLSCLGSAIVVLLYRRRAQARPARQLRSILPSMTTIPSSKSIDRVAGARNPTRTVTSPAKFDLAAPTCRASLPAMVLRGEVSVTRSQSKRERERASAQSEAPFTEKNSSGSTTATNTTSTGAPSTTTIPTGFTSGHNNTNRGIIENTHPHENPTNLPHSPFSLPKVPTLLLFPSYSFSSSTSFSSNSSTRLSSRGNRNATPC